MAHPTHFLLAFVFLVIISNFSSACPTGCTCDSTKELVNCMGPSVTGWPQGIPATTKVLLIRGSYSRRIPLRGITEANLAGLNNLQTLAITYTEVETIDDNAFKDLTQLRSLDLSFNKLTRLAPTQFEGLTNLIFLYLTGNEHCSLPNTVFKNLRFLKELYLGGMALTSFDPEMFSDLLQLVELDLSDNQISELPGGLSKQGFLPVLKNLDLSFNQLKTLSNDTGQFITRVAKVELAENPWHCNCELKWLRRLKQHVSPTHQSSNVVMCQTPPQLTFQALVDVPEDQLNCTSPTIVKCDPVPVQYEGDTFTVKCNMSGDPFPDISWSTADGTMVTDGKASGQVQIQDSAALITLQASVDMTGTMTIMAQNVIGLSSQTLDIQVKPSTTSTTTTTTTTTTVSPPVSDKPKEEGASCGDNMMLFIAAGVAGASLLVSAIVTGVACKKIHGAKVKPRDEEEAEKKGEKNNNSGKKDDDSDSDDYGVEQIQYDKVNLHEARAPRPPTAAPRPLSAWDV